MKSKLRKWLFVAVAAGVLFGALATTAYADLDSEPAETHGVSQSNPGAGSDHWWRAGLGPHSLPRLRAEPTRRHGLEDRRLDRRHALQGRSRLGDRHRGRHSLNRVIDSTTPNAYYRASFGGTTLNTGPYGTNQENTIDMLGIYDNPPLGGWGPADPNASYPVEGQWYLHYRYFSSVRYSNMVHTVGFGIDTTPPDPVAGLEIRTGLTSSVVTTWQPRTRAHITWTPGQYDHLAGVGYYEVLIDDKPIIPEKNTLPEQGRAYAAPSHLEGTFPFPSSIVVEDMPPGAHKVSVVAVDRATNKGPAVSAYYYSDPDTPTITITAPTNGLLKETLYIAADAFDAAGPPSVKFALDGSNIATLHRAAVPLQAEPHRRHSRRSRAIGDGDRPSRSQRHDDDGGLHTRRSRDPERRLHRHRRRHLQLRR